MWRAKVDSRTYEYVAPAHALKPRDAAADWVFDEAARQALNAALLYYVGTHNFHNYTNGKTFTDHEAKRIITQFTAMRTTLLNDEQFVVFRIRGQSFMLHQVEVKTRARARGADQKLTCMRRLQIRKMVAAVISMCRDGQLGNAKRFVGGTFQEPHLSIPKAPAVGLFLRQAHFDKYNANWGGDQGRQPIELTAEESANVDVFAERFVWPEIAASSKEFSDWIASMEVFPLAYADIMQSFDAFQQSRADRAQLLGPRVAIQSFK